MKKFTKMLALGLAAVLTFGMSVQAAPDPSANKPSADNEKVEIVAVPAEKVETAVAAAAKDAGKAVNVISVFEMNADASIAESKTEVTLTMEGVERGDVCYAYKYADAEFTTLVAKIALSTGNGSVTFVPVDGCFYVVVNEGKAASGSGSSSSSSSASGSAAASPKTGETVPAAGVMALVLMAGAVICAKKVRYSR